MFKKIIRIILILILWAIFAFGLVIIDRYINEGFLKIVVIFAWWYFLILRIEFPIHLSLYKSTDQEFQEFLQSNKYWLKINGKNKPFYQQQLQKSVQKYGLSMSSCILLPSIQVMDFLSALEGIGLAVEGFDAYGPETDDNEAVRSNFQKIRDKIQSLSWTEYGPSNLEYSYYVGKELLLGEDVVFKSIEAVKSNISQLPQEIQSIAIYLHIPPDWDELLTVN